LEILKIEDIDGRHVKKIEKKSSHVCSRLTERHDVWQCDATCPSWPSRTL